MQCVVAFASIEGIVGPSANEQVVPLFSVECCVDMTTFKGVITGSPKEPEALLIRSEAVGIAGVVGRGFGGEYNDDLSGGWLWSFAATDADGERKDLNIFSESFFLRYEGENAGVTDVKKASFISFCDSVFELFSCVFCVVSSGLIVEIEDGLASI